MLECRHRRSFKHRRPPFFYFSGIFQRGGVGWGIIESISASASRSGTTGQASQRRDQLLQNWMCGIINMLTCLNYEISRVPTSCTHLFAANLATQHWRLTLSRSPSAAKLRNQNHPPARKTENKLGATATPLHHSSLSPKSTRFILTQQHDRSQSLTHNHATIRIQHDGGSQIRIRFRI
ncbi:hypothetical protein TNIN_412381 [Trichonephila inaurata madagascariensis]|uniref:Uncharacterized protein n=1 Tax=Trichonephila inaurata madagascariensis TaxID=2747483 RepID=A0A8X6MEQ0_9ARAC|nr:hypothetical protein TNIN_93281 [Trichonephila inaurata madagascariensis]GFY54016.1 hypothetical protein TNIN_412381 [Trichonephila inaurata madagascariensis]